MALGNRRTDRQTWHLGAIPIASLIGAIPIASLIGAIPIASLMGAIPIASLRVLGTSPLRLLTALSTGYVTLHSTCLTHPCSRESTGVGYHMKCFADLVGSDYLPFYEARGAD